MTRPRGKGKPQSGSSAKSTAKPPATHSASAPAADTASFVQAHPQGAVLAIRAQAGARTSSLREIQGNVLKVACTQVPEQGKANKVLGELLSNALGIAKSRVELLSGATNPNKRFLVHGVTVEELVDRIRAALPTS